MLKTLSKITRQDLIEEANRIADKMILEDDPEEFKRLEMRYRSIEQILERNRCKISPDTLLIVGANLLGILLILNYERLDIVSSRALSFVMKGRV